MEGLRAAGEDVLLATPPGAPLAERAAEAGVPVLPLPVRGDLDLRAAARLARALAGVDVLHLHTGHAHAVGLLAAALVRRPPAVVVTRRVDFPPKGALFRRWKYGRRVAAFIAISRNIERVLLAAGVSRERIHRVPSGIDPERFRVPRDREGLRRELAVPQNAKLVGFIGALVGHKAPWDLVDALARLGGEVHGVFAGAGDIEERLRHQAASLGVAERIHFLGHREDVPRLMRSIDLFALPSRLEGLGTAVLEAMAAEVPVVATRAGGLLETVESGVSGLLVPPGDPEALARAVRRVLEDPELTRRLVRGGTERVAHFTRERMVKGNRAVYETILRGRPDKKAERT